MRTDPDVLAAWLAEPGHTPERARDLAGWGQTWQPLHLRYPWRDVEFRADTPCVGACGQRPWPAEPVADEPVDEPVLVDEPVTWWARIEDAYRRLATELPSLNAATGRSYRRRILSEPSRPEVARALDVAPSTVTRECVKAGRGSRWPPDGL